MISTRVRSTWPICIADTPATFSVRPKRGVKLSSAVLDPRIRTTLQTTTTASGAKSKQRDGNEASLFNIAGRLASGSVPIAQHNNGKEGRTNNHGLGFARGCIDCTTPEIESAIQTALPQSWTPCSRQSPGSTYSAQLLSIKSRREGPNRRKTMIDGRPATRNPSPPRQRAYGTMQLRPHGSYPCSLPDIALQASNSFLDPPSPLAASKRRSNVQSTALWPEATALPACLVCLSQLHE